MALTTLLFRLLPLVVAGDGPDEEDYRPQIHPASEEAAQAMGRFELPEGFRAELFAAEPLLANPVAFFADAAGRFYVCETFRHSRGVTDIREHRAWLDDDYACRTVADRDALLRKWEGEDYGRYEEHHERVRRIVDEDGDGVADSATVFADGFHHAVDGIGAGLLVRGDQVWYACMPDLWSFRDADDDGVAEERTSLHHGYGVHIGLLGHDLHGLVLGPDARLYFSFGDRGAHVETADGRVLSYPDTGAVFRCELDGSGLECFHYGLRNPQELVFNEFGDLFTGENNSDGGDRARWVHVVEGGDTGWRIGYQWSDRHNRRGPWNAEKLWFPAFENQAAYIVPPRRNMTDGPSGLTRHPGTGLDASGRYDGYFFLCDFRGDHNRSGVHAFRLEPEGASWKVEDFHRFAWKVLATDVDFGPDGQLYVSDWIQGWDRPGKGRLYRLAADRPDPRAAATQGWLASDWSAHPVATLADLMAHADQRVRLEAELELVRREQDGPLWWLARHADRRLARLHAIWGLGVRQRRGGVDLDAMTDLLGDGDAEVRAQAAKVLGEAHVGAALEGLIAGLEDESARVRHQCAVALGRLGDGRAFAPLCELLARTGVTDPVLRHGAILGLQGLGDVEALRGLAGHADVHVRVGAVVALRRLDAPEVADFLGDAERRVRTEAARAINDRPIEAAMPALADRAGDEMLREDPGPLILRVLNANDRLGRAGPIAALARDPAVAVAVRREAVRVLGDWADAQPRDRVTNAHRPLAARDPAPARAALASVHEALLADPAVEIREMTARQCGRLLIGVEAVHARALDAGEQEPVRRAALIALERLGDASLGEAVGAGLASPHARLRSEARRILANFDEDRAFPLLRAVLESPDGGERQSALRTLAVMDHPEVPAVLAGLVTLAGAGKLDPALELELGQAIDARGREPLRRSWQAYLEGRAAEFGELAPFLPSLRGGDAQRGRKIFFEKVEAQCLRCHKVDGEGTGEAGPDLTGVGDRLERRRILESIALPNAVLSEGYSFELIFLKNGLMVDGQVLEEDEHRLRVRPADPDQEIVELRKEDVDLRKAGKSSMPADVIEKITPEELRDLVEFLSTRRAGGK